MVRKGRFFCVGFVGGDPFSAYVLSIKEFCRHIPVWGADRIVICNKICFLCDCAVWYFQLAAMNSSRKRTSFSEKRRRSFTWYFRLVIRSIPIPKA